MKETLLIRDLKPAINVNTGSENIRLSISLQFTKLLLIYTSYHSSAFYFKFIKLL